jgi:transcriptional regulator with XRE-family HTH domain
MQVFAKKLRLRAEALELSNAEVARRAGLTERRYSHYVTGSREPDLATLIRIAKCLNTTPDDLLGVKDGEPKGSRRTKLLARLMAAAHAVDDEALELLTPQLEAVAKRTGRSKVTRKKSAS